MSEHRNVLDRLRLLTVGVAVVFASAACDQILEVTNPGDVTEEGLAGEEALPVVVNGVYGDFQDAYDEVVQFAALFTDELVHSGSFPSFAQVDDRAITPPNVEMEDIYTEIGTARFTADRAVTNIREVLGAEAESSGLLALALAFGGYSRILLADNFCQITLDVGPPLTPAEVYGQAIDLFTQAIQVAQAADADSTLNLALVGRARARLNTGDLGGAAADAAQVPAGFVFVIDYSDNSDREENELVIFTRDRREMSVGEPFRNTGDPRVPVCAGAPGAPNECPFATEGEFGPDNQTPLFVQLKYADRLSDIRLASGAEAALIAAEASGQDVAQERGLELWLEGHRLADMRRRNDPFLQGGDSCFPIPQSEIDTNPNL
ncbi:MAG TPA: hypothetical protein VFG78_09825 [Gemmatimonadota bacterium]|nr:hypothetical protein [Gemmatimonadota bacterium]